jgi:uncharacterized protein (DUF2345 family)
MSAEDINTGTETPDLPAWPVLATVVSHADPATMGALEVSIKRPGAGNTNSAVQIMQVQMISPFFGSTSEEFLQSDPDNYNNTRKSYGMWFVPPDVGTTVLVIFINGDPARGYWYGCVPDEHMNFSVPGLAATTFNIPDPDATFSDNPDRLPVAEFNATITPPLVNPTLNKKPAHPFAKVLDTQGLLVDDTRGITSSSARREAPSAVFGISTPGPLDKKGPKGLIGKAESKGNTFISRLGGTTFVMDDGDDAFQRKTTASDGPPEYASIAENETGLPDVPHNELVRIRTRTGHQILLHNSEDLIYIGNARGTSWIELSSDGKIDIYAEDSISVHTKQDMNFYAKRDINMEAGRNFNIKVAKEMHTEVLVDHLLIVGHDQKIQIKNDTSTNVLGNVTVKNEKNFSILTTGNINLRSNGNTNIIADQKLSLNSGSGFDLFTSGGMTLTSTGATNIKATGNLNQTSSGVINLLAGPNIKATAGRIDFNSASNPATPATPATPASPPSAPSAATLPKSLSTASIPDELGEEYAKSIMRRIPMHEPWALHENLDPTKFKPDLTDRDADDRYEKNSTAMMQTPDKWKKYSANSDTFNPPPPADQ